MRLLELLLLVLPLAVGENRLWWLELELRGPCAEIRLDCGPHGSTRVLGPFSPGEDRRLRVPVPVRAALGARGLESLPLPLAEVFPAHPLASVRVLGWSENQPAEGLRQACGALLARPRPVAAVDLPRAARGELMLVLGAGLLLLVLRSRRRLLLALPLSLAAAGLALVLARSRSVQDSAQELLEWELDGGCALSVRTARNALELPADWLEVEPAGVALELLVDVPAGSSRAMAAGSRLAAVRSVEPPRLGPRDNAGPALELVWTRSARGAWSARAPWPAGGAPPGPRPGAPDPPGWLAGLLPPGRSVLLARTEQGLWLRCVGMELEAGD